MSAVTPVISIVMPPLAGMLADKIGNFRVSLHCECREASNQLPVCTRTWAVLAKVNSIAIFIKYRTLNLRSMSVLSVSYGV